MNDTAVNVPVVPQMVVLRVCQYVEQAFLRFRYIHSQTEISVRFCDFVSWTRSNQIETLLLLNQINERILVDCLHFLPRLSQLFLCATHLHIVSCIFKIYRIRCR